MKRRTGVGLGVAVGLGLIFAGACGMLAQSGGDRSQDETAIREAGKEYVAAMKRGDATALADFWTAHGTYTDRTGRSVTVAELLKEKPRAAGNPAGEAETRVGGSASEIVSSKNSNIRFVTGDVAVEEGDFIVASPDGSPEEGRFSALWVRDGQRWKLDHVRELAPVAVTDPGQLAGLDIFVGKWRGENNRIAVEIFAGWDTHKKFLTRHIRLTSGDATLAGTQFIGWDPLRAEIRSWMFSDDGSFAEGTWELEGNAWMAVASRVLPDGRVSEGTQVYQFPDKETMVWKILDGAVDGSPTDDCEVTLKKAADEM